MEDKYKISFEEIRALLNAEHYQQEDIANLEKAFNFAKKFSNMYLNIVRI